MKFSKRAWIALLGVALVITGLIMTARAHWEKRSAAVTPRTPSEVYLARRGEVLGLSAAKMNIQAVPGRPVAYGVLMDLSVGAGTATIVSLSTGDTSMYTSTGGGITGGIGHETCRTASQQFIAAAQGHLHLMRKTATFPVSPAGVYRFYVLTTEGVYTAEDRAEVLTRGQGPLTALFQAGDNVVTQLRLIFPK